MSSTWNTGNELDRRTRQACEELERRLRAGESYQTEDCLAANPDLAANSDATLEILYFEYVLREEMGQTPPAEECYRRFPEQRVALEKILKIHHGFGDLSRLSGPSAAIATFKPGRTVALSRAAAPGRLSRYDLLEELGRGSMGVVYKARERALDRIVALKVILAGRHAGVDDLVRVHREARAIARLQHPNIVQIHEFGEDDGRPFLCMEYIDGPGLDRLLPRWQRQGGPGLTPEAAARLLQSVARAVHYAHQQGIVHRDLKPANILLQRAANGLPGSEATDPDSPVFDLQSAVPKIADFGLAKFLDNSSVATQTGDVIGTPSYMAPEQADGRTDAVGPAVDIYALGVILYELLTGWLPFLAATVQETLELARTAEPTPPRRLRPHLPRDLQTICLKCLAKEPASRYASALALAEDLRSYLAGEPIRARPATLTDRLGKWVKRRPVIAGLLAALLLAIVAGGTGIIWEWRRAEQNARNYKLERDKALEERGRALRHLKSARESMDELAKLGDQLRRQPQMNQTSKPLLEKVLAFYQEVLKDESADPDVRLGTALVCQRVAQIRQSLGQLDAALEACQQESSLLDGLLKDYPDKTVYRLRLGESLRYRANVLRDLGKTQQARDAYREGAKLGEQVLAMAPADPAYQASLANTLYNFATVLSRKEHAQEKEALFERAVALIKSALKTRPDFPGYRSELGLYLEGQGEFYRGTGRAEQAEKMLRESVAIRERLHQLGQLNRWTERYLGRAYNGLGLIVAGRGRPTEALEIFDKAAAILSRLHGEYPDDVYYRNDLISTRTDQGYVQSQLRNYPKAAEYYRQAVKLDPKSAEANNSLAWFLATCPDASFRDVPEAIQLAKIAIAAQPEGGDLWNTLGAAYYRAGDYKAAVDALTKAAALHSQVDASDWFFLAMAHWKLGNSEEARRWLAKGVEWLQRYDTQDEELQRFQAEAQALLSDSPIPVRPANSPPANR